MLSQVKSLVQTRYFFIGACRVVKYTHGGWAALRFSAEIQNDKLNQDRFIAGAAVGKAGQHSPEYRKICSAITIGRHLLEALEANRLRCVAYDRFYEAFTCQTVHKVKARSVEQLRDYPIAASHLSQADRTVRIAASRIQEIAEETLELLKITFTLLMELATLVETFTDEDEEKNAVCFVGHEVHHLLRLVNKRATELQTELEELDSKRQEKEIDLIKPTKESPDTQQALFSLAKEALELVNQLSAKQALGPLAKQAQKKADSLLGQAQEKESYPIAVTVRRRACSQTSGRLLCSAEEQKQFHN